MGQESLKAKTIVGVFWSALQKFGTMLIAFVANMILARLLSPDDFGCIGMLAIFITLSKTFIDGGFGSALIQKKNPTETDYSTIFYWNLFVACFCYAVLFFTAPVIARFYDLPLLEPVLRVEGIVLIINALSAMQNNRLRKQLQFRKLALIEIVSALLTLSVTIVCAFYGWGIWALVLQQVLMSLLNTLILWVTSHWHPRWCFSWQSFKELFNFGFFILLSNLVNAFCNNIQGLLIGKWYNPMTMGYYSQGKKLEEFASTSISTVVDRVAYPVLAEAQNDLNRMSRILSQFISSLAYLTIPLMLLMILLAKPLIVLLYSAKWLSTVPYFQILCIAGIAISLQGINYYAVAAVGKSGHLLLWTLIKRGTGLLFVVGGLALFGMRGLLGGMVLTSYMIYVVNAVLVHWYVGYKIHMQLLDLLPVILISLLSFTAAFFLGKVLPMNMYLVAALQFLVYVLIYASISYVFKLKALDYFLDIAGLLLQRIGLKKNS